MKLWFNEHTSGFRFNSMFITGDKKKKKIKMEKNPTIILVKALAASAATWCSL